VFDIGTGDLTTGVKAVAERYDKDLSDMMESAQLGTMNLAETTVKTTKIQQTQSMLEMVQGVAKAATEQLKGLGKRIG
jgi:DNA uptake protein ComE-like DNA-binding protein